MPTTSSDKIEISPELAKRLIPVLEDEIVQLENQMVSIEDERDGKRKELDELKIRLFGRSDVSTVGKRKRLRKGESDKIIYDFIRTLPPNGSVNIQQIVERTGVSYTSTYRILKDKNKNKGRFIEDGAGQWTLEKK